MSVLRGQNGQRIHHGGGHVRASLAPDVGYERDAVAFRGQGVFALLRPDEADRQADNEQRLCGTGFNEPEQFEQRRRGVADHEDPVVRVGYPLAHRGDRTGDPFVSRLFGNVRIGDVAGERTAKGDQAGLAETGQGHIRVGDDAGAAPWAANALLTTSSENTIDRAYSKSAL